MAGQLFKQLALTITYSMIASIFAALFLVPRLALRANLDKKSITAGREAIHKYFVPMLKRVLAWPVPKMMSLMIIYTGIGLFAFLLIPKEFMPKVDERRFVLNINMHPETPLDVTNELTKRVEKLLSKYDDIDNLAVTVGSTGDELGSAAVETLGVNQARIIARLKPASFWKHDHSTKYIVTQVSNEISAWKIGGLEFEFITQQGLFGSNIGGSSGVTIEVKGKNLTQLRQRSEDIKKVLSQTPVFYGIKISPSDLVPELKVQVDRERASLFGLSTQDISAMSLAAIKGFVATKLKLRDDEYDIRVRMRPEDRDSLEKVTEMTAYSPWGMTIQLKQISLPQFVKSLPEIKRTEGQRTYLVTANIKGSFSSAVSKLRGILKDINSSRKSKKADDDITTTIGGEMLAMRESMQSSIFAIALGILIIYMILSSQFESLVQPLIVMTAVPLGLIGAIFTLLVTFKSINAISMLGMIMLVGNVVSISIMLVDRYNVTMAENPELNIHDTVIHCTAEHIRPILMTTLTTIVDLFPLALGIGEGAEATAPMAIAVVGGLSFALVLTLFFVPFVYIAVAEKRLFPAPQTAPIPEAAGE
jgi:HAE1 family hydrophobic/amphiphilic exporter-1